MRLSRKLSPHTHTGCSETELSPTSCLSVSSVIVTSANTNNIFFVSGVNKSETSATSQNGREGNVNVCTLVRPKLGTSWGKICVCVCVCSEVSRLQLHHKAAFILKVETEGEKEGRKEGRKERKMEGNQATMQWPFTAMTQVL